MANWDNNDSGLTPDDKRQKRLDWAKSAYSDDGDEKESDARSNSSVTDKSKVLDTSKVLGFSNLNLGDSAGRNYVPDFRTIGKGNLPNAGNNTTPGSFNVPDYGYGFPRQGTGEFLGNLDNRDPRRVNFNPILDTSKVLGDKHKILDTSKVLSGDVFNSMTEQQKVEKIREDVPPKDVEIVMICIPTGEARWLIEKPWDGSTIGHTHYIVQKSMEDASAALNKWFNNNNLRGVNKIVFDAHGSAGCIIVRDTKKQIHMVDPVTENRFLTNLGTAYMDVRQFYNPSTDTMARDVAGLKNILKKVNDKGIAVFLACRAAVGDNGRELGKAMYYENDAINLYLSQAYDDGAFSKEGRLYYHDFYNGRNVIRWDVPIVISFVSGRKETIVNKKPFGYVKFSTSNPEGSNLGLDGIHDGNLYINGWYGTIKEVGK